MMKRKGHKRLVKHRVSRKGEDGNWWVLADNPESEKNRAAGHCCTGGEDPVLGYTEIDWETLRLRHCKEHSRNCTRILEEEQSGKLELVEVGTKLNSVAWLLLCCYCEPGGYQLTLAGSAKRCSCCSQQWVHEHGCCYLSCWRTYFADKDPDVPVGQTWVAGHEAEGHLCIWCSLHQVSHEDAQCLEWVALYCYSHKSYDISVCR
jgi:hypothetical protein